MSKRTFFFGIDSATWDVITPWVRNGKLPGFSLLMKGGTTKRLVSTIPPITPVAWTSLYTGVNPGKHGIYDFYRLNKRHDIAINSTADVKRETIFDYLSRAGKRTAVLNLPLTYPVRPLNGIMVGGFTTPGIDSDFIYPASLRDEFLKRFPRYSFIERGRFSYSTASRKEFLDDLLTSIDERIALFDWIEQKERWDVFAVNFMEVDHAQHWFWKFYDKSHPDYGYDQHGKDALYKVYKRIDAYLLKTLRKGAYNRYVIFSDHGAGKYVKNINVNLLLLQEGLLKLRSTPFTRLKRALYGLGATPTNATRIALHMRALSGSKPGTGIGKAQALFLNMRDIDWHATRAFSFGSYGQIYLVDQSKKTREQVIQLLKNLEYEGKPLITALWERETMYTGPYVKQAPHLMFSAQDFSLGASAISPFVANTLYSHPHTLKSGEHRMEGIVGIYPRTKVRRGDTVSIPDISATLLDMNHIAIPYDWDGVSLLQTESLPASEDVDSISV